MPAWIAWIGGNAGNVSILKKGWRSFAASEENMESVNGGIIKAPNELRYVKETSP
jgi:hypothetical protein